MGEAKYEIKRLTMQSDSVKPLGNDEWEILGFKRVVVDCHAWVGEQNGPFKCILEARANTLSIHAGKAPVPASTIARDLKFALKRLSTLPDGPLVLPANWRDAKENMICSVTDAMLVAGQLHVLRDGGGFGSASLPSFYMG